MKLPRSANRPILLAAILSGLLGSAAAAQDGGAASTPAPAVPPAPAAEVSPAVAATAPAPAADVLKGLAAWDRVKGNTIEGKQAGEAFAEYFEPGGAVRYVDKDGLSKGTWSIKGEKVCFDFPDDDDRSCATFEVSGDTGKSTDEDGSVLRFTILPGNTKAL